MWQVSTRYKNCKKIELSITLREDEVNKIFIVLLLILTPIALSTLFSSRKTKFLNSVYFFPRNAFSGKLSPLSSRDWLRTRCCNVQEMKEELFISLMFSPLRFIGINLSRLTRHSIDHNEILFLTAESFSLLYCPGCLLTN